MKQRITLSMALVVSLASLALPFFATTTQAQQVTAKARFDTGVVTLGPQQILRLTVDWGDGKPDAVVDAADYVVFRRMDYGQEACGSDGVCKLVVTSQTTTNPIRLRSGEAVHTSSSGFPGVRIVALTNRRIVRVTATIINSITGETTSHIIVANTDGDIH